MFVVFKEYDIKTLTQSTNIIQKLEPTMPMMANSNCNYHSLVYTDEWNLDLLQRYEHKEIKQELLL